jgi:hypothetical protein
MVGKGFGFLRTFESDSPRDDQDDPFGLSPQRLVFGIEGFERRASLVVSPLVEPAAH